MEKKMETTIVDYIMLRVKGLGMGKNMETIKIGLGV